MKTCAALLTLLVLASPLRAGVVWEEDNDGEISNDPSAPTPMPFTLGSNMIFGTIGQAGKVRDCITFTVPAGQMLAALYLLGYTAPDIGFAAVVGAIVGMLIILSDLPCILST